MCLDAGRRAQCGRILADVGDIARFADRNRFASWIRCGLPATANGHPDSHRAEIVEAGLDATEETQ